MSKRQLNALIDSICGFPEANNCEEMKNKLLYHYWYYQEQNNSSIYIYLFFTFFVLFY